MSILTPKESTSFEAVDSDAFLDGASANAHLLQRMAGSSNYLTGRNQWLVGFALPIPPSAAQEAGDYDAARFVVTTSWRPMTVPMLYGKPGTADTGSVRLVYTADQDFLIQVATKAAPFNPEATASSANVVSLTSGTLATGSLDGLPLPRGANIDEVTLYVKGTLGSAPSGVGTPLSDTDGSEWISSEMLLSGATTTGGLYRLSETSFTYWSSISGNTPTKANWDTSGTTIATEGCALEFLDPAGRSIVRKLVIFVEAQDELRIEPLSPSEIAAVRQAGGRWQILRLPNISIFSFSMAGGTS